jgi:diguanylate cyclase (GGDEF)-like protein
MRVLIAEDEEVTAARLRGCLVAMGHDVVVATDGLQAWELIQKDHMPLVISDWSMPHLDGPSLCRRIRGQVDSLYTYVMLLTAKAGQADRMDGLRAGADDFLIKPVHPDELAVRLEIARRILAVQERLQRQNEMLAELASTDELTGLANRREFFRMLETNFAVATRQGIPLSLVFFDVDHFKTYNDAFGHIAGDGALRMFGQTVRATVREHETVARYGGEEFAAILLGTSRGAARDAAERLRSAIAKRDWPHRRITASFGVSTIGPAVRTVTQLVDQADVALYLSKRQGRDRVSHYDEWLAGSLPDDEPRLILAPAS